MKLATIITDGQLSIFAVHDGKVIELGNDLLGEEAKSESFSNPMAAFIKGGQKTMELAEARLQEAIAEPGRANWRSLSDVRLAAPFPRPSKNIFCVGRNYKAHIEEGARARGKPIVFPKVPEIFTKPPTGVIGQDDEVRLDTTLTQQLDYEVELAIVIGTTCRDVPISGYREVVFGYTILNDISARDLQLAHVQFFKGKSLDTFCPVGPWIVTADEFGDPSSKEISLRVNGETRQHSSTGDLLFNCAQIVASLSQGLTLEPGDVIATGTPAGVALGMVPQKWLLDGDSIEAEIEGIGILRNKVRAVR